MEHSSLHDLLLCLEYGTNLHISVVFLDNHGNAKTRLPFESAIHSKPYCDAMKALPKGLSRCFRCRNIALKKAIREGIPFGGQCINGVYEYVCPVVEKQSVIAVIFIGNIFPETPSRRPGDTEAFAETFEHAFDEELCKRLSRIVSNHIRLLIREYSNVKTEFDPLVSNILGYIEETLSYDISVSHMASVFNYSEKYIGRLFRKSTGKTIKEYFNEKRLIRSGELLRTTDLAVTEVSAKVGFNNVTYFNRLFRRYYGMTPTEYRWEQV